MYKIVLQMNQIILLRVVFLYIISSREEDDKLERYVEDLVLQVNTSALVLK